MAKDPVCGMDVEPQSAFATREHMEQDFFFCSQQCVDTFDRNPHQYGHRSHHNNHASNVNPVDTGHHDYVQSSRNGAGAPIRIELAVIGLQRSGGPALERAITVIPGVSRAIVNTKESRVFIDYDPESANVSDLLEAVRSAGFTPGIQHLRLRVKGLYCAECVGRIETALKAVPGVLDSTMNA
ncbi:MAG: cation transporter, partial [Anaerolinea sp.]|nr:cation transporter [Anaerolinea sp.]